MSKKKRRICRSKNVPQPESRGVEAWGTFGELPPGAVEWAKEYFGIPDDMPETVLGEEEPDER